MIGRATGVRWLGTGKTKSREVQRFDECLYDQNDIVLCNIFVQMLEKENTLVAVGSFEKALHPALLIA